MDLSDLLIFKTVAEQGGIVRAAERLHRVQSNVSTRIKQLEASLGVELFFRAKQRLHLSPQGQTLLAYADRLLCLADEARAAVDTRAPRGTLRLGALESTAASRLPAILSAFHERCPEVSVELSTGTNDVLVSAVADRRLDAAFIAQPPAQKQLSFLPLFAERLVVITSLAHRPVAKPAHVAGDSVIAFPQGCAYRRIAERWLGPRVLLSARMLELSSYHAIVACVAAGTGIAIIPESVLDTVQGTMVGRHALPEVFANVTTPLIWRSSEDTQSVSALRDLIQEQTRRRRGPRRGPANPVR